MTTRSEMDEDEVPSNVYWIPATFVSGFLVLYTLIHAIVYIDGSYQSCRQYRLTLPFTTRFKIMFIFFHFVFSSTLETISLSICMQLEL